MDKILSIRKNYQVFSLFLKIKEYQKSSNRTEIINLAINKALEVRVNWKEIEENKIFLTDVDNVDFPDFIQLKVEEDKYYSIVEQMKTDFNLVKSSPAPFVVRLLLSNYLLYLESLPSVKNHIEKEEEKNQHRIEMTERFKALSVDDKLNTLYETLLSIKEDTSKN